MNEDRARNRFLVINAVRIVGVALVLVGILAARGIVELPREAGYFLIAIGIVEVFLMPQVLARKWRSRPGDPIE